MTTFYIETKTDTVSTIKADHFSIDDKGNVMFIVKGGITAVFAHGNWLSVRKEIRDE